MNWLRSFLKLFYAPACAMGEMRDLAPLRTSLLSAWLAQSLFTIYTQAVYFIDRVDLSNPIVIIAVLFGAARSLLLLALIFVPAVIFVTNLFERRGSFRLVVQQEYAAVASTVLSAWTAANLAAILLGLLARVSGLETIFAQSFERSLRDAAAQQPDNLLAAQQLLANPELISASLVMLLMLSLFGLWTVVAVNEALRLSRWQSVAVTFASGGIMFVVMFILLRLPLLGSLLTSPFLLLMLFFLLRGYAGELLSVQRARVAFKQNLEAATLNPADASAHYNLGLIHLQRNELDQARQRFERATQIDPDEIDAHYQLGRLSRMQNRLPEAITHFEQVVARDPQHAQHEVWREIGATYVAAEQYADARDALERFLERRPSDAEGLYLMGRALAGLGHRREAAESMQACIEAVKTAPAYKYRTERRWLNEAQAFLRSQA